MENNNSEQGNINTSSDYRVIIDMIREADDYHKMMIETTHSLVKDTFNLNPEVLDYVLRYDKSEIENLDTEEIRNFLDSYSLPEESADVRKIKDMDRDELVKALTVIKDASLTLLASQQEVQSLKKESNDVLNEYFNYMSSDKIKESRKKRLELMKNELETVTDEVQKKKIVDMIATMEASLNFDFLKTRFNKLGDDEISNIEKGFFDEKRGTYIIEKFKTKIVKFGYRDNIFQLFLNIEENFLDEKYAPYNNLFLFIYTRMVAYSNPDDRKDKLFVQTLTGALANLIYHKFDSTTNEQQFLSVISNVLDYFEKDRDMFISGNTTYINHPMRQEVLKKHETRRREALIKSMDKLGIKGYDKDASIDDLQEFYNNEVDLLTKKQLADYNSTDLELVDEIDDQDSSNTTIDEDGVVNILPTIQEVTNNE